jgi:hypothetical protein
VDNNVFEFDSELCAIAAENRALYELNWNPGKLRRTGTIITVLNEDDVILFTELVNNRFSGWKGYNGPRTNIKRGFVGMHNL